MQSHFHQQMDQLKLIILRMAALTERAVANAVRALFERDAVLAEEVIRRDQEVNQLEIEVDNIALKLLALDQPVARDLRFIVSYMRISSELERIADQAVNIAQRAVFLSSRPPLPPLSAMERLSEAAMDMFKTATHALMNENVDEAHNVCEMDDEADEQNIRVLKTLIDHMVTQAPAIERSVQTIIVARCLERIGDLCTNIAESVIFMVKGVNVKHGCQD